MYDTLHAILNKSENVTLQYFIFCEKVLDEKYLLKFIMFSRHPASVSSKLHQFVSFDVWVMFLFCNYSFIYWILQLHMRKKDCYAYQNSSNLRCINTIENCIITWNKLRNKFQIYQICKKKGKMSPLDIIGNTKYLVIFDLSRFSITFFLLPNQVDLSAHCYYHFSTSNVLRLRCNNTLIFLWGFQW